MNNITAEDLIDDPQVLAQRFLNDHAKTLQRTAAGLWASDRPDYLAEATKTYALARQALWAAAGWSRSEVP